mmetsp:Transcript_34962/g.51095  ORF Transcript_34962/g.51095 Transcript_34962/m.51095 type:complete len:220 (+) Transcript_34962:351-1010(+)
MCSMSWANPTSASTSGTVIVRCRWSPWRSKNSCCEACTTMTRSPAVCPMASSATFSNRISSPSRMPGWMSTVRLIVSFSVWPCGQALQLCFQHLPRATHAGSLTWTCCTKPGANCCCLTLIPGPWQSLHVFSHWSWLIQSTWRTYSTSKISPTYSWRRETRRGMTRSGVRLSISLLPRPPPNPNPPKPKASNIESNGSPPPPEPSLCSCFFRASSPPWS